MHASEVRPCLRISRSQTQRQAAQAQAFAIVAACLGQSVAIQRQGTRVLRIDMQGATQQCERLVFAIGVQPGVRFLAEAVRRRLERSSVCLPGAIVDSVFFRHVRLHSPAFLVSETLPNAATPVPESRRRSHTAPRRGRRRSMMQRACARWSGSTSELRVRCCTLHVERRWPSPQRRPRGHADGRRGAQASPRLEVAGAMLDPGLADPACQRQSVSHEAGQWTS